MNLHTHFLGERPLAITPVSRLSHHMQTLEVSKPHRSLDVAVGDRRSKGKSAMVADASACCSDFLSVNDADADASANHYLFRSHSQSNLGGGGPSLPSASARPGRSHSVLGAAGLHLSCASSSPECSPTPSPALTPKAFGGGDDVGEFVIDFASCHGFQITTEHVQVPTIDIYALAKRHSSKYGGTSSRAKRQSLFRAETGPSGNAMFVAPKPRSVSIFGSLLAQAATDADPVSGGTKEDTDMLGGDDGHGVLTRAQSDSVALKASTASSSPLASFFKTAKRMKGACGARLKGGAESRRRRALDFSEAAAPAAPSSTTKAFPSVNAHPSAAASLPLGGRQRSPSTAGSRPSTLTRKRSRDFLGRDHDHPANMPLQRGRKTMRSCPTDDCSSSPCLVPSSTSAAATTAATTTGAAAMTFFSKLNKDDAPSPSPSVAIAIDMNSDGGDFPLPSTPSLSSQSQLSRSPSSPSLSLSLANDCFSLCPTADRFGSGSTSTTTSTSSSPVESPPSASAHKATSHNMMFSNLCPPENNSNTTRHRSSFSSLLDDCDTDTERERERGTSLSSKENRDPSGGLNMNGSSSSSRAASSATTKGGGGARRALAMGALDDDSDVEMDISKPDPIKLPEVTNMLPPLRMAPLNAHVISPPKSAPAMASSLGVGGLECDPRTLLHAHHHAHAATPSFTFGQQPQPASSPVDDANNSHHHHTLPRTRSHKKNTSPVKFPCVHPMATRRSSQQQHHQAAAATTATRTRSNTTQTREVHTFSAGHFAHVRNLSASEMSQTCPLPSTHARKPKPVGMGANTQQHPQHRKNSISRPVPVMPSSVPNFVSLDVVNENTPMDDAGALEGAESVASESDSSPSRTSSGCASLLPIVRKNCMIPEISGATLRDLVGGAYRDKFDHFAVVDCRYVYEYRGGHIKGALSLWRKNDLTAFYHANRDVASHKRVALVFHCGHIKGALSLWRKNDLTAFYHANRDVASHKRVALVFHCEYSKNRAPRAAAHFRKLDRTHNEYPQLSFPNLFVLNGGYRQFYRSLQADPQGSMDLYCDPPAYVSMWDEKFIRENKMCKDLEKPRRGGARSRTASTSDAW